MKTIKDLKVGDKAYFVGLGWGIVSSDAYMSLYPISVVFDNDLISFTIDGRLNNNDKLPSLFLTNPFEQRGEVMLVSTNGSDWYQKDVIVASNGIYVKSEWIQAKEIEQPQELILSMQEIAEKFNIDVNLLKIKK
jgi:hypothetical protein